MAYTEIKPLTEASMDLSNGQDDCNSFKNYKAFVNNFGELIILKDKYDKQWKVYTPTRTEPNDYIYSTDSRDNIEGWLYGAVMANNGIFKNLTEESLEVKEEFKELEPMTEAPNIEMKTTGTILDEIKSALDGRCGDILDTEVAKIDDVVGLKLTRKGKQDLVTLFDTIKEQLSAAGIDSRDYEIDLKGDSLVLAMKNMAI